MKKRLVKLLIALALALSALTIASIATNSNNIAYSCHGDNPGCGG